MFSVLISKGIEDINKYMARGDSVSYSDKTRKFIYDKFNEVFTFKAQIGDIHILYSHVDLTEKVASSTLFKAKRVVAENNIITYKGLEEGYYLLSVPDNIHFTDFMDSVNERICKLSDSHIKLSSILVISGDLRDKLMKDKNITI